MLSDEINPDFADRAVSLFIDFYHSLQVRTLLCYDPKECLSLITETETRINEFETFAKFFHIKYPRHFIAYESAIFLVGDETKQMIKRRLGEIDGAQVSRAE
jgi:hypothetical protein